MQVAFPSQLEWKPYGHLICTPVSLLVATTCLHSNDKERALTAECVSQIMEMSHRLYQEIFSQTGQSLRIQDLFPYIPSQQFECTETAGTILPIKRKQDDGVLTHAEGMIIECLHHLLRGLVEEGTTPSCLIATANEHTVCFFADECGELFLFDPLPASLCKMQNTIAELKRQFSSGDTIYSGLLLRKRFCSP